MSNTYRLVWFLTCFLTLFLSVSHAEERFITIKIDPKSLEVKVIGVGDNTSEEIFVGTGDSEWLTFYLPEGEYRYVARLDGYYDEHAPLPVLGVDVNSEAYLTQKSEFAASLDAISNSFGEDSSIFFILLFVLVALAGSAIWGFVWRRAGAWWYEYTAYHREERWNKSPSPVSQELAIKNGVALIMAGLLALTIYTTKVNATPNPNTLTYEQRIIITLLFSIPLYNFARLVVLSLKTLSTFRLRRIWKKMAQQLVEEFDGEIWRFKQPNPRKYNYLLIKSLKTQNLYQVAISYAKGRISKEENTHRLKGNTRKLSEHLDERYEELEAQRKALQAEVSILFMPSAMTVKSGPISDNVILSGEITAISESLNDLAECLIDHEEEGRELKAPREHGVKVEKQAIQDLKELKPKNWKVRTAGYRSYIGNIDARLVIPNKQNIVIEIKSYRLEPYVNDGVLQRSKDKPMIDDIQQTKRNARRYRAKPVLWLPIADPFVRYFDDVLIIGGDAAALYRELDAPTAKSSSYSPAS